MALLKFCRAQHEELPDGQVSKPLGYQFGLQGLAELHRVLISS